MMTYKCKICGGDVSIDLTTGIAICDYCGTKQSLPRFTDDSSKLLYERGNNYLLHNEYDKAENIFNQLLSIKPNDCDIHWSLVMCKYGVTFVCDPKTGKYIPTCNRTHYTSVFNDENYKKAIEFSTGEKTALYQADAKTIDEIQRGILSVSKKEKPFDIFISYKETNSKGNRTQDSIVAQNLYEKLTKAGYKVFFSRITLEDKIGTEYEPYIYAALSSSKVMLTICSSKENIEAPWVKNEWSRFLTLRQNDSSKTLIPLYFDMQKSDLPDEFAILSAQDMKKEDFEQELIRGIKKLIPLPIMLAERRKKIRKRLGITAVIFAVLLVVSGIISTPYIVTYVKNNNDYQSAMDLYNQGEFDKSSKAFEKLGDFKNSKVMQSQSIYDKAMNFYYEGNYPEAAWTFKEVSKFKDAEEMQDKSKRLWRESLATVATDNAISSSSWGSYYISANGSVETFNYNSGNCNDGIEINEHGKIVSIGDGENLYALHEDGYVTNSAKNNQLEEDWQDVIQITSVLGWSNVALKSDGTIVYSNSLSGYAKEKTYDWLAETKSWKNIVSLSWDRSSFGNGIFTLTGIDSEGKIYIAGSWENKPIHSTTQLQADLKYINSLADIRHIWIAVSGELLYIENGKSLDEYIPCVSLNVLALDNRNNLICYADGKEEVYKGFIEKDFDVKYCQLSNDGIQYIDKKGILLDVKEDKRNVIMEDVVYFKDYFIITQSGSVYNMRWKTIKETEAKVQVKDVWLGD